MLKPFVDAMSMNPAGGHRVFEDGDDSQSAAVQGAAVAEPASKPPEAKSSSSATTGVPAITFSDEKVVRLGLVHSFCRGTCLPAFT